MRTARESGQLRKAWTVCCSAHERGSTFTYRAGKHTPVLVQCRRLNVSFTESFLKKACKTYNFPDKGGDMQRLRLTSVKLSSDMPA